MVEAGGAPGPPDDFGSPIVLALFLFAALVVVVIALVTAGAACGAVLAGIGLLAIAAVVVASILIAVFFAHLALATIVWTRRPPVRVLWGTPVWGLFTLLVGVFAAVPFWWLHYVRSRRIAAH
jgi:hypothetical protein